MRNSSFIGLLAGGFLMISSNSGQAATARPVVLELFTSQSCSSCPPADALLGELAARGDVLALDFHVDYWDYLGWKDRFSSPANTARQRAYASSLGVEVYTPQLVVDGGQTVVGSARADVEAAISKARAAQRSVEVNLTRGDNGQVRITVAAGGGNGAVLLVGFDPHQETSIGGGENSGRKLTETNVVRGFSVAGHWSGAAATIDAAAPAGERLTALVQAPDGRIIGAATPL